MKIYDDQNQLHLSIVQRIQPGQLAIVSTGGMTSAVAECTGTTHNGIWIKDEDGHPYFINWAHVRGIKQPEKLKQAEGEPMTKAVIVVTDPRLLKSSRAADDTLAQRSKHLDVLDATLDHISAQTDLDHAKGGAVALAEARRNLADTKLTCMRGKP